MSELITLEKYFQKKAFPDLAIKYIYAELRL